MMRYIFFILFFVTTIFAQNIYVGFTAQFIPAVQEYLINANREILIHKSNRINYGVDARFNIYKFQTGLIMVYGKLVFSDPDLVLDEPGDPEYLAISNTERRIDLLKIGIPILYKININEYANVCFGAVAGIVHSRIYDKMDVILSTESGNFKDRKEKNLIIVDPKIEGQIKLQQSINVVFGLNYSLLETDFKTDKEDINSLIRVYKTEYRYKFTGFYYSAGIYYNF